MPDTSQTLDPTPNYDVESGKENKAVRTALELIRENLTVKSEKDQKNRIVRDLIEEGFEVQEPNGTRRINLKKLQQAYWKTASRMKPLDFTVHAAQRPEFVEKITRDGLVTVLRKGGYVSAYRDKGGAFQNALAYGDAFVLFGTVGEKGFPLKFVPLTNDNVYVDTRATTMRGGSKPVKKCAVIMSYTWSEFVELYPDFEDKAGTGRIPRERSYTRELDQDSRQAYTADNTTELVEVCHYYDISNMNYTVFAGAQCTVLEEKGKDLKEPYPFAFKNKDTREEEAYIPIMHTMCMESFEGFYNHGLFEMIYDLAKVYGQLFNKQANHIEDNADPYVFFSVPQGRVGEIFQKMDMAAQMRQAGKRPIIPLEYDPNNPNASQAQASAPLTTQSLVGEAQRMFDLIDREIKRLGIHLDELESGNVTATQILSEEENANMFVKQMMEKNASETEFLMDVVIDMIPKIVSKRDKTPLQLTTLVEVNGQVVRPDQLTLGNLSDELSNNDYFVKVNARSGTFDSKLKRAQVSNLLQLAPPGSAARAKLLTQFAQLNDQDIRGEDFGMPQQQAAPVPTGAPQEAPAAPVADTERLAINPRQAEQTAAI